MRHAQASHPARSLCSRTAPHSPKPTGRLIMFGSIRLLDMMATLFFFNVGGYSRLVMDGWKISLPVRSRRSRVVKAKGASTIDGDNLKCVCTSQRYFVYLSV